MGGDSGAAAHRLRSVSGGNLVQRLEQRCAFVEENGTLYALESLNEQETEALNDFLNGDLVGHGLLPGSDSIDAANDGNSFDLAVASDCALAARLNGPFPVSIRRIAALRGGIGSSKSCL